MKKIYLVGLAFALLTASCDDVLEKTSSTQLPTIDAISSVADLTNAVNSAPYEPTSVACCEWRIRATGYRGRLVWSGIHIAGRFTKWGFPIYLHGESCRPHVSLPNR